MARRKQEVTVGTITFETPSGRSGCVIVSRTHSTMTLRRMDGNRGSFDSMLYEELDHPYDLLQEAISEAHTAWSDLVRGSAVIEKQISQSEMADALD